ncbi:hypothetical protein ACOSQ2_011148 [Xanthoceras sorbifolium]
MKGGALFFIEFSIAQKILKAAATEFQKVFIMEIMERIQMALHLCLCGMRSEQKNEDIDRAIALSFQKKI